MCILYDSVEVIFLTGESDSQGPEGVVVESPPLQRVKAISEASEASESSSVTSQGWDELGKYIPKNSFGHCVVFHVYFFCMLDYLLRELWCDGMDG